ncbi:hypothetical protein H4R21_005708, partial [Coemansia helicoidea]
MSTEFERLLRLAEQNTADIQRISLERKRHVGQAPAADTGERAAREKRQRLELERRIRQREQDGRRQREDALERRRRERQEAERLEAERRETKRREAQRQEAKRRERPREGRRTAPASARGSVTQQRGAPLPAEPPRRPAAAQPLSYEQLMDIASGAAAAPAAPAKRSG